MGREGLDGGGARLARRVARAAHARASPTRARTTRARTALIRRSPFADLRHDAFRAAPAREPLPQLARTVPQGPAHQEPEAAEAAAAARGQRRGGGRVRLLADDVHAAGRLRAVRGGVQAARRLGQRRVDHEADRPLAGQGHLHLQDALRDLQVAHRQQVQEQVVVELVGRRERRRQGRRRGQGRQEGADGAGGVRRAALHREPVPHRRQEVRPAPVHPRHVVYAAHGVDVPRRLLPLLDAAVRTTADAPPPPPFQPQRARA